jgi:hypothetical protein
MSVVAVVVPVALEVMEYTILFLAMAASVFKFHQYSTIQIPE